MPQPKIAIAIPSDDQVKTDFALSLAWLMRETKQDIVPINIRTSLIPQSRFELVEAARKFNCDKIFFIDSDMVFPGDALERLLAHEKDLVGATYIKRRTGEVLGDPEDPGGIPPQAKGLHRMKLMPIGFSLITMSIFDHILKPWFNVEYIPEINSIKSEDYTFITSCIKAGFTPWCDLDLSHELGHVSQRTLFWGTGAEPPNAPQPPG